MAVQAGMVPDRARRLLMPLILVSLVAPVLSAIGPTESADAATWACPVEDRTTRPNGGGATVSTFVVQGVDLSHWDSGYKMQAVSDAGFSFAFYKATQGTYLIDKTYRAKAASGRKAGIKIGAYHFFDYRQGGVAQARFFVASVRARGGFHGHMRPVVDVECLSVLGKPSRTRAVIRLRDFINEVKRLTGVKPIIYTSIFEWNTVTGSSARFADTVLWSAEWGKTAPLKFPPSWDHWTFWQHGSVHVLGVRLDGDVFAGSATALKRMIVR